VFIVFIINIIHTVVIIFIVFTIFIDSLRYLLAISCCQIIYYQHLTFYLSLPQPNQWISALEPSKPLLNLFLLLIEHAINTNGVVILSSFNLNYGSYYNISPTSIALLFSLFEKLWHIQLLHIAPPTLYWMIFTVFHVLLVFHIFILFLVLLVFPVCIVNMIISCFYFIDPMKYCYLKYFVLIY
jgi:hypothetical protein